MSVFNHPDDDAGARSRLPLILAAAAGVALIAAIAWWNSREAPSAPAAGPASAMKPASPAPRPTPSASPSPEPSPEKPIARRSRGPSEPAAEPEPAPAPPPVAGPTLVVESDVPGASVFLNRKYLGTTPLKTTEVTAGSGQLNVSAEGYDGVARAVDIAASGTTEVTIRLKEVRLDASVAVVHKHGMGSCDGTLRASVAGLRYDTSNKGDAFVVSFGELEAFEIDYLGKGLKVKKRGGRTWNFTTKEASADPLFVFHRDVEKARGKLAP
jgi:hypothetical protein